jgi:hypothetical protein
LFEVLAKASDPDGNHFRAGFPDFPDEGMGIGPVLAHTTRVWAPDSVIALLTGPFTPYLTFAEVPRDMRAAPDAKTWAAVQLWMWWSGPTGAGYTDKGRVVCRPRMVTLFNTMLAVLRANKAERLPSLPQELWVAIFGLLKHNQPPSYARHGGHYDDATVA